MDNCIRDDAGNGGVEHSGTIHEWTVITPADTIKFVLCEGHSAFFNIKDTYPLPVPCNCRICTQ